jgi:citrate lyase subunit beta/citryl-CoA lyase
MDGKTLIHPSQVAPCNEIFSPSAEEVTWSRAIIQAFAEPQNARLGVITVEGKMVERLHLVQAKRTVAIAEAIEAMRRTEEEWF